MAEGDCTVMNNFKEQLMLKTVDCVNDDWKVALYDTALGDPDGADPAYSATNEINVANYTAGGVALTGEAVTQDDTNDWAKWDANDPAWTSLGAATVLEGRLYNNTTTTKWVAALWEIATNPNGGNYTLQFHTNGMILLN